MCVKKENDPDAETASADRSVEFSEGGRCCCRPCCCPRCRPCSAKDCRDSLQIILLFLGVVGGIVLGIFLRQVEPLDEPQSQPKLLMYIGFPGELLLRFMTMLSLPLIVCSLVSGIASLDALSSVALGGRAIAYYVGTTCMAVVEGFIWIYVVRPGANVELPPPRNLVETHTNNVDMFLDLLRNIFPDNFVSMSFRTTRTESIWENITVDGEGNETLTRLVENYRLSYMENMNILGVSMFAIIFGIALASMDKAAQPLVAIIHIAFDTIMKILQVMIWLFPLGIASMVTVQIIVLENPLEVVRSMAVFIATVIGALMFHVLVIMPLLYLALARKNPFKFFFYNFKALMTAFATGNSSITLPVTLDCLERKAGVSPIVTRFMCPIGATVNMDGFALYEGMAAVFIALLRGLDPGPLQILTLGFTAVMISIGAPTTGGGIVTYVLLFRSIGLPLEDISLLVMFDWLLTRFRTMTNVWGDCIGSGIVESTSQKSLQAAANRQAASKDAGYEEPNHNLPDTPPHRKSYTLTMRNEEDEVMKVSRL